jgi:hypothetical protein
MILNYLSFICSFVMKKLFYGQCILLFSSRIGTGDVFLQFTQPFVVVWYLESMKTFFKNRLQKEHKRWLRATVICALAAFLFSNDFSEQPLTNYFIQPFEFLKNEQDNPFNMIFTIFKPKDCLIVFTE